MRKLRALLLTEGMHGMISQVEGMAKALNTEYSHKIVRLSFPWNLIPPKFTPVSKIDLKENILSYVYSQIISLVETNRFSKSTAHCYIVPFKYHI